MQEAEDLHSCCTAVEWAAVDTCHSGACRWCQRSRLSATNIHILGML